MILNIFLLIFSILPMKSYWSIEASVNLNVYGDFIYEEGEWESMIVDLVSREVATLPMEDFVDEPELEQRVFRNNKISLYKKLKSSGPGDEGEDSGEDDEARVVYKRKSVDSKTPIVVLKSHDDHLKVFERKRTFVVLRQNPLSNNTYFAFYVYLRFWTDKQEGCTETYLNEKICLEYDTWDNDRGEVKASQKYFGWTDCASSFLFSCRFNAGDKTAAQHKPSLKPVERGRQNTTFDHEVPSLTNLTFRAADGLPFDDTIDVFFDLEPTAGEGDYIRKTIKHSSIFNNPKSFLGRDSSGTKALGRSLGSSHFVDPEKLMNATKEHAKITSKEKSHHKRIIYSKLSSRTEWFHRKNHLNNLVRSRAKELGFREFYKIKNDASALATLKRYKDTGKLYEELESLGQVFEEYNEIIHKSNNDSDIDNKDLEILAEADVSLMEISNSGGSDSQVEGRSIGMETTPSPVTLFGKVLTELIGDSASASGRSMTSHAADTKIAESIAKSVLFSATDLFEIPGWKAQEVTEEEWTKRSNISGISLKYETEIFYGLGTCPFKKGGNLSQLLIHNGNETEVQSKVIEFHLNLLRTYCVNGSREYLEYLLHNGFIRIDHGKFLLVEELSLNHKRKLRLDELRKLSASVEIASFSQNYAKSVLHPKYSSKDLKLNVSQSVHFIQTFGLLYLNEVRKVADQHFIKLIRCLVLTLKGVMTKLLQDLEILLARCSPHGTPSSSHSNSTKYKGEDCEEDFVLNYNDRLGIHSFMEFLMRGLAPIEMSRNKSPQEAFQHFQVINQPVLIKGVIDL